MSYETILEEIKTVPEEYLDELSTFISFLKYKTSDSDSLKKQDIPRSKKAFFDAIGKISFDKTPCEELRERSII